MLQSFFPVSGREFGTVLAEVNGRKLSLKKLNSSRIYKAKQVNSTHNHYNENCVRIHFINSSK